ncbi:MAG: ATP-binding protein [Candidatus Omnitrophica bacterium]|nr:ATP-binding protein [Candidatus Omnitrophota bacterium]
MKQIVIISGKGGTGKTVMTGALAALAQNKVMADCDVDAADLHLLLSPTVKESHEFRSGKTAWIDQNLCRQCGKCISACRFEAITEEYIVDPIACEGCGFCSFVCPQKAIIMQENLSGDWFVSDTRFGPMVHAKLGIAEENSGKLVALVRKKAKELAESNGSEWVIIDGAPGIGCPVIASLSGIDCALVVTEPTLSGLHDASRVIEVARHFSVPVKLVINKYDLNTQMSEEIEKYCCENNVECVGKIMFDKSVVQAMVEGKTIIEYEDSSAKEAIIAIWEKMKKDLRG